MTLTCFLDHAAKAAQVFAAIGGAIWGIYLYRRNRTHKHRLRLTVTADRTDQRGIEYLVVKAALENVGLERVEIVAEACEVTVFADLIPSDVEIPWGPTRKREPWEELGTFSLFKSTQYLEPNSLINDQILVAVPMFRDRFLRLQAHAQSRKVAWNAIFLSPPNSSATQPARMN